MTTTSRWQRKWERDHLTDGWSPIPTQIVSNEEYVPMPPTREQRRVADRLREMSRLHFVGEQRVAQALHQHLGHLESPQRLDLPAR